MFNYHIKCHLIFQKQAKKKAEKTMDELEAYNLYHKMDMRKRRALKKQKETEEGIKII